MLTGHDAEFECQVGGDPSPKILWRRENQKLPSGRAQILDSNSLRITSATASDEGAYICDAENEIGSISARASLTVHGKLKNYKSIISFQQPFPQILKSTQCTILWAFLGRVQNDLCVAFSHIFTLLSIFLFTLPFLMFDIRYAI